MDSPPEQEDVVPWLQVRDLDAAHRELAARVTREPRREPWGLREMWLADPDGTQAASAATTTAARSAPGSPAAA